MKSFQFFCLAFSFVFFVIAAWQSAQPQPWQRLVAIGFALLVASMIPWPL